MKRLGLWIQWHRRAGLLIAPIVLMLVITGILINHSQQIGWHSTPVFSSVLGRLYGIPAERVHQGFLLGEDWLTQSGDQLYLNTRAAQHCEELTAAIRWPVGIAVLCDQNLLLLTDSGELIERVTDLPDHERLGRAGDSLAVAGENGEWLFDDASLDWQPLEIDASWAEPRELPLPLREQLNTLLPLPGVTLERVLLDLHSGRLFGDWGVWLVDAAAILLLFLAFSGTLTWAARSLKRRRR